MTKKILILIMVLLLIGIAVPSYAVQAKSQNKQVQVKKTQPKKAVKNVAKKKVTASVKKVEVKKNVVVKKTDNNSVKKQIASNIILDEKDTDAKATTTVAVKKNIPASRGEKITWTKSAIKASKKIPAQVRKAVMKKIEKYAERNGITTITPEVMDGMRE